jgi:hypothetical protein
MKEGVSWPQRSVYLNSLVLPGLFVLGLAHQL